MAAFSQTHQRAMIDSPARLSYRAASYLQPGNTPGSASAQMAELVDALASGASIRKDVEVRVLFWAPTA